MFSSSDHSHPDVWDDFNLHFSNDLWCWICFHILAICISSLKRFIQVLCLFFNQFVSFCCCQIVELLYISWILIPYQTYNFQIFLPLYRLSFHSVACFLMSGKFLFWCNAIYLFLHLLPAITVSQLRFVHCIEINQSP